MIQQMLTGSVRAAARRGALGRAGAREGSGEGEGVSVDKGASLKLQSNTRAEAKQRGHCRSARSFISSGPLAHTFTEIGILDRQHVYEISR